MSLATAVHGGEKLGCPFRVGLALVVLVSWVLRLFRLDYHTVWLDEAYVVRFTEQSWAGMLSTLRTYEAHPPFYFGLMHLWLQDPLTDAWLRAPSAMFGAAMVAAVGALGRRLFGPRAGLAAALLAAMSASGVWYSQEARMYAPLACFAAWNAVFLVSALEPGGRAVSRWALVTVTALLGLFTHYFFAFAFLGNLVLVGVWRGWRRLRAGLAPLAAACLLAGAPWAAWVWFALPSLTQRGAWAAPAPAVDLLGETWRWQLLGPAMAVEPTVWQGLAAGAALLVAAAAVHRAAGGEPAHQRAVLALGAAILAPLAVIFVLSLRVGGIYQNRYVVFLLPALLVLVAGPVFGAGGRPGRLASVAYGLVLGANLLSLGWYWFHPLYGKGEDFRLVARAVAAEFRPGDVLVENDPNETLRYYLNRVGAVQAPWVLLPPAGNANSRAEADAATQQVARAHQRVWLTERTGRFYWDAGGVVEKWLRAHCPLVAETSVGGARVMLFEGGQACS